MNDLIPVFRALREIMLPYAAKLDLKRDDDVEMHIDTRYLQKNRRPLYFGAVQVKKFYVSFDLMPVYVAPMLLDGISAALGARMQGKSCFNFTVVDRPLFAELAALTAAGYASYREQGFVP